MTTTDIERAVAALATEHDVLDPVVAHELIVTSRRDGRDLGSLVRDAVPEDRLLAAVAGSVGMRFYDLFSRSGEFKVDDAALESADVDALKRYCALPLRTGDGRVFAAVAYPSADTRDYLTSRLPGLQGIVLCPKTQILNKLAYFDADAATLELAKERDRQTSQAVPAGERPPAKAAAPSAIVAFVDRTLERAAAEGVSDIHLSFNQDQTLTLKFRSDGILVPQRVPVSADRSLEVIGTLLSKTATMDSSNYREPQDGTFTFSAAERQIDVRVAMLPQINGPTVVLRLLDSMNIRTRLEDMGFSAEGLSVMRQATSSSAGTVLVSGPTGSGKSTTLYGLLRELDSVKKHIITVEDPVEYKLQGINQTAIRSGLGEKSLTFAKALRSILRLDPDIILVGEIRDVETARTAMDAAITGHLVLSTVHSNSAIGIYTRLIEMGVPPYLVSEAITLAIAQRLLRRVHECAVMEAPTRHEIVWFAEQGLAAPEFVAHPVGCSGCTGGYRGRLATIEYLEPSRRFKSLVSARAPYEDLEAEALATGFKPIVQDGLRHVADGRTTVAEVVRVLATGT